MKLHHLIAAASVAAVLCSGCGKSDTQKQLEQANDSLKAAAKSMTDNSASSGNAQSGDNNAPKHKPVPAVDFHKMEPFLPSISGYSKADPKGASMQMSEWNYSNASAEYTNGDARIIVSIFDYAYIETLMAAYKMKFNFENEDGYTKTGDINGFPGWETWTKKEKNASCTALVNDRFVVVVEGNGQNDASLVKSTLAGMDLKGIGALQ